MIAHATVGMEVLSEISVMSKPPRADILLLRNEAIDSFKSYWMPGKTEAATFD